MQKKRMKTMRFFSTKRHMRVIAYRDQIYVQCTTCVVNDCIQFVLCIIANVNSKNQRALFTKFLPPSEAILSSFARKKALGIMPCLKNDNMPKKGGPDKEVLQADS